jgi:hypothetical protein
MMKTIFVTGIMATVLKAFGWSGQTASDEGALSAGETERGTRSEPASMDRQVVAALTEQIIDATADEDLLQVVYDALCLQLPEEYQKVYATVMSWNSSRQAIYVIWQLEAQVNNGGYDQFYFNSTGRYYAHVPDALMLVGATKFAALTKRANELHVAAQENAQRQDSTLVGSTALYDDVLFDQLDNEFYALYATEDLPQLQVDYIRRNKQDFIDK